MKKVVDPKNCALCEIGQKPQPNTVRVPGYGNPNADIMLIGEAPGKTEALTGLPFVGDAGQDLDKMLRLANINREDLFIANICKCWPYIFKEKGNRKDDTAILLDRKKKKIEEEKNKQTIADAFSDNPIPAKVVSPASKIEKYLTNRKPTGEEMRNCSRYLAQEIEAVDPKVIVALGSTALSFLEGSVKSIMKRKGIPSLYFRNKRTYIYPTLHPSFVSRNGGVITPEAGITKIAEEVISHLKEAVKIANNESLFIEHKYTTVCDKEMVKYVCQEVRKRKVMTFDIETSGLDIKDEILGIGIGTDVGVAYYFPFLIREILNPNLRNFWETRDISKEEVIASLKDIFEDESIQKSAHGAKFDMRGLKARMGIEVKGLSWDSMCGSYILDENSSHRLDDLKNKFLDLLGYSDKWNKETNKGKNAANASLTTIAPYCCGDCDAGYRLTKEQIEIFKKQTAFMGLMQNYYVPIMEFTTDLEYDGIMYDIPAAKSNSQEYAKKAESLREECIRYAGKSFDVDSPEQVAQILFTILKLKHPKRTKEGAQSTDRFVLEDLAVQNVVPKLIVDYRHICKMKSTYMDRMIKIADRNDRIHLAFNPIGTVTTRFSSEGLQNLPRELAIKSMCIAPEGYKLVQGDESQVEVRCLAHYAKENVLRSAFEKEDIDIHSIVASEIASVSYDEFLHKYKVEGDPKFDEMRSAAKACLRKDMRVITNRGLLKISDLGVSDKKGFVNLKNPIKVINDRGKMALTDKAFNNGRDSGYTIETKLGYIFSGTKRHKITVLSKEGKIEDKRLQDIEKSDYVAIKNDYSNIEKDIKGSDEDILKDMKLDTPRRPYKKAMFSLPKKLDRDWGWFIGFLVGEGSFYGNFKNDKTGGYRKKSCIAWSTVAEDMISYMATLNKKILGNLHIGIDRSRCDGVIASRLYNVQLRSFFDKIGFTVGRYDKKKRKRVSSYEKDVPEIIFNSSYECMRGFLQGVWDAEGTVKKSKRGQYSLVIASASISLIKNMQLLMCYFGVITKRYKEYNKKYKRKYNYLRVCGHDSKLNFLKNIGFPSDKKKQKRLETWIKKKHHICDSVQIPHQKRLLQYLYENLPPSSKKRNDRRKDNIQIRIKRNILLRQHILNQMPKDLLKGTDPRLIKGYYFDQIVKKKKETFKESYDLSVPNSHHYNANGFTTHNTTFGISYGMSAETLAIRLGISVDEAKSFINRFFGRFPSIKRWIDETHRLVEQTGEVMNIFGMPRRLPNIFASDKKIKAHTLRQAVNAIIQSTAALITGFALIGVHRHLKANRIPARIVLTVHDSIVVETRDDYVDYVQKLLVDIMERKPAPDFSVKLRADIDVYQKLGLKLVA